MLVLVVGDAHIPHKANEIPGPIKKLLIPGKIQQVVSVGNISDPETLRLLQRITPQTHIISVPGCEDMIESECRTSQVFDCGGVRVGVVSSFEIIPQDDIDSLAAKARQLDVRLLLWGSCHQDMQKWANSYFLSPGSITGTAVNGCVGEGQLRTDPGFCLLDISDTECTVFMYNLHGSKVLVDKAELSM